MTEWTERMFCTQCGWSRGAHHSSLFHSTIGLGCCPQCGAEIKKGWGLSVNWGEPFVLHKVCWVSTVVWYKPSTWGTGYWVEVDGSRITYGQSQLKWVKEKTYGTTPGSLDMRVIHPDGEVEVYPYQGDREPFLLVTRCMGPSRAPRQQGDGNVRHLQVLLLYDDGVEVPIYTGPLYDEDEWRRQLEELGQKPLEESYDFSKEKETQ